MQAGHDLPAPVDAVIKTLRPALPESSKSKLNLAAVDTVHRSDINVPDRSPSVLAACVLESPH
jgi:hypothetical protein